MPGATSCWGGESAITQSEREQYMDVVRERDMWREKYEREHAENARLRKELGKVRRTALEKPFGEHTPSGKQLVKPSAPEPESEEERLKAALDAYAEDPDTDMFETLFGGLDLAIPKLPRKPLRKLPKSVTRATA